ncbi:uncharacterized protein LOC141905006 isoform X2 [Tubulanus polymorphus]|uniref:uncharacterized protein LOC141905006 isoform X2 n=1 Tax=Tubulanus polymorphus TaxID=672921 RepID=UPI003DA32B07
MATKNLIQPDLKEKTIEMPVNSEDIDDLDNEQNCVLDKNQNNINKSVESLDMDVLNCNNKLHDPIAENYLDISHAVSLDCLRDTQEVNCDLSRFSASADVLSCDSAEVAGENFVVNEENTPSESIRNNNEDKHGLGDSSTVELDTKKKTTDKSEESNFISDASNSVIDGSLQPPDNCNSDEIEGSIQVDGSILSSDLHTRTFVISNKTTAKELISLVLTKYNMASRDPNLFYLTMETSSKNTEKPIQSVVTIGEMSCPLDIQLNNNKDTKFCIQMKSGGLVKVYDSCLTPGSFYKSMFISKKTTSRELIKLLLHYYKSREYVDDFVLMETDDQGNELRRLSESECPLITQQRWKSEKCFQLKRIGKKSNSVQRSRSFGGVSEHGREHLQAALKRSAQRVAGKKGESH